MAQYVYFYFQFPGIQTMDMNDERAVVRNKGDGLDDEECPEKVNQKVIL